MITHLVELFNEGGTVMYLICLVSFTGWLLALRGWVFSDNLIGELDNARDILLSHNDYSLYDNKHAGPLIAILTAELQYSTSSSRENRKNNKAIFQAEIEKLGEYLRHLNALAGILPLLGLLGTVLGMLITFNVINNHGTGEPILLAAGIRKALLTTQAGLFAALPILFFHHVISHRKRIINTQTDLVFHELETRLKGII